MRSCSPCGTQDGGAPWSTVDTVTFTNNIVRHAPGGINILGP